MNVKTDNFPFVAASIDEAWAVFRDFEKLAYVYVEALTPGAVCEVASGPTLDPALLTSPSTLTFSQAGTVQVLSIPIGGSSINRATRVKPTNGRVSVSFVAPSHFTSFMRAPDAVTFGL